MAVADRRAPRVRSPLPPGEPRPLHVSLVLAAASTLSLLSLGVLLAGQRWWVGPVLLLALVLGAAAGVRSLAGGRWLASLAALVVALAALTISFAPGTGLLGVLPGLDTLDAWGALAREGAASVGSQAVPARSDDGIVFLISILAAFMAVWGDLLAVTLRQRALAAAPLALPFTVPLVIQSGLASLPAFALVVLLWLAMLRLGRPRMPLSATLGVTALAVVGSLLVPLALPAPSEPESGGGGLQARVNPLIDLGEDLRRSNPVTALTYSTDSEEGLYLRLSTLERFSGRSWSPVEVPRTAGNRVVDREESESGESSLPAPEGLDDAVPRETRTAAIEVESIGGRWLPVPYPAAQIDGLAGDWFWEPSGLSVRSSGASVDEQAYDVDFLAIAPTREQLASVGTPAVGDYPEEIAELTELPRLPDSIEEAATAATAEATTNYERALALQEFFREGDFTYSEETPVEEGYDGTGTEVIARFLEVRAGYCVHFASAMAVMARTLDIPSRVAVGFQPGDPYRVSGEARFQVSTHDLHAWPELYFPGVGWTRFEPTVSRGEVPEYATPAPVDDPATPDVDESTVPPVAPTAAPTTAPTEAPSPERDDAAGPDGSEEAAARESALITMGIVALLLLLLAMPALLRVGIRAARIRRASIGPIAPPLWEELRDTARDHGWVAADSETPRDFAARLAAVVPEGELGGGRASGGPGGSPLSRLLSAVEHEVYASPGGGPAPDADARSWQAVADLRAVRSAIGEAASRREQLRAVLLPPSIVDRWLRPSFGPRGD